MTNLEKFKAFKISKETTKKVTGGKYPSEYELITGDYSGNDLFYEPSGGRTRPTRRYTTRHGCQGDC